MRHILNIVVTVILIIAGINFFKTDNIDKYSRLDNREINLSNEAYEAGYKSFEEGDYKKAINRFHAVIPEDDKNYNNAQEMISESIYEANKQVKVFIESCKISKGKNNQIQVKILNKFDKTIKDIYICFICYDENNEFVYLDEAEDNDNYLYLCMAQDINVEPYETFGNNQSGWNIPNDKNIKSVYGIIKNVEFLDGTKWENPLFYVQVHNVTGEEW